MVSLSDAFTAVQNTCIAAVPAAQVVVSDVGTWNQNTEIGIVIGEGRGAEQPLTLGFPTQFSSTYTITCTVYCWGEEDDVAGIRDAALTVKDAVRDQIMLDRTMGLDPSASAYLVEYAVQSQRAGDGVSAQLDFIVQITLVTT